MTKIGTKLEKQIIQLYKETGNISEVSRQLGICRRTVANRVKDIKVDKALCKPHKAVLPQNPTPTRVSPKNRLKGQIGALQSVSAVEPMKEPTPKTAPDKPKKKKLRPTQTKSVQAYLDKKYGKGNWIVLPKEQLIDRLMYLKDRVTENDWSRDEEIF